MAISFPTEDEFRKFASMKHVLSLFGFLVVALGSCTSPTSSAQANSQSGEGQAQNPAVKSWELNSKNPEWDGIANVEISENAVAFVGRDTLEQIARDMQEYFQLSNDGDWVGAMGHHPLHRREDTTFVTQAVEVMEKFSDMGLRNRTESVEILYASAIVDDNDQEVLLINMDLVHFVEFAENYEGNVAGMKGMVESNYGKGNATYHEGAPASADTLQPYRYWEVRGQSRIWALSAKDADHWCFLPANFNEGGGAMYMGGEAMVEALRHRRDNDPNYEKKR